MSLKIDITKRFPGFTLEVAFEAGAETLGFLGASGCGKSLTLRCIAGIETPDEGYIAVNDQVFFDSSRRVNLKPQQRKTALLFQNYMLFPNLTAAQNIAAGIPKGLSAGERDALVSAELKRFSLEGLEKRYPAQLSGGQQQRVALARMLAARPGILMLDEPFSALDSHLKSLLEQNLANLFDAYDGTILYVSHDIDEALHFCDRIAVVEDGRIREIDTGDELINHPQSRAGIRLSGCKNNPECVWRGPHAVFVPRWGVTLKTAEEAPRDVIGVGVRAFFLQRATGPGVNCFRVVVERVSDARFDRTAYLRFLDREADEPAHDRKGGKPDEGVRTLEGDKPAEVFHTREGDKPDEGVRTLEGDKPAEGLHTREGDKPAVGIHNHKGEESAEDAHNRRSDESAKGFHNREGDKPAGDSHNHKGDKSAKSSHTLEVEESAGDSCNRNGGESAEGAEDFHTMKEHLTWRVDKLQVPAAELPSPGDELWIRIPPDRLYLVSR